MDEFFNKFKTTSEEYTPIPFWFLNDAPDEAEIRRQLMDFKSKGIDAAVLHPRIGLPDQMAYLSDEYFDMIGMCLENMAALGMRAVLYDEGMYPSGSAGGLVAKSNPEFASRALIEKPYSDLSADESCQVAAVYAVKLDGSRLVSAKKIARDAEVSADEQKLAYVCGYSGGTIRGIHACEDDGKPDAPKAGDILGKNAVERFISLTHDEYYRRFKKYFGGVIIGFFTDEPCPLGRNAKNTVSWTPGFPDGEICHPALFHDGEKSEKSRRLHDKIERELLSENFYGRLHGWCAEHNIALMGHPSRSGELSVESHFDVPGQDIVWRYVAPDKTESDDCVYAKCAADAMDIYGKKRCSVEAFGVCGRRGNPWEFTASELFWHLNYMFVRGVNMVIPHAFYYSLRTQVQSGERPPDVGPNSPWWQSYKSISEYIKRLCALNTDSKFVRDTAILIDGDITSDEAATARLLEERLIGYGFAELSECRIEDGKLCCGSSEYTNLLVCDKKLTGEFTEKCVSAGIRVVSGDFEDFAGEYQNPDFRFDGVTKGRLRASHLRKHGMDVYILSNENGVTEESVTGTFYVKGSSAYLLDPFTGETLRVFDCSGEKCSAKLSIPPYSLAVIAAGDGSSQKGGLTVAADYVIDGSINLDFMSVELFGAYTPLSSDGDFTLEVSDSEKYLLRADELHDTAVVTVDKKPAGAIIVKPFTLDITKYLDRTAKNHRLSILVIPSSANLYGRPVDCAISGLAVEKYKKLLEKEHE